MFARTTTVHGTSQAVEEGIAQVRDEVMPAVREMEGCVGLSMLADRSQGTCIVTTAWDSDRAMRASREKVQSLRARAAELLGGEPQVQEWEIALLHRERASGEGACSRVTWLKVAAHEIDHQVDVFRSTLIPQLEQIPGFCSASVLVDRDTGRASSAVTYESRRTMEDSRETARTLRDTATKATRAEIYDIAEFDLVLAHLRVPETV